MREHKYRAWDIERKEMFTPMILNWIPSGIPIGNPIQLWHQRISKSRIKGEKLKWDTQKKNI